MKVNKRGAFQDLTPTALAFGGFVVAVVMVVIVLDNLGDTTGIITPGYGTTNNETSTAQNVSDVGRDLVGTLVTSWSSLIILFIVFGILFALLAVFLVRRAGRNG